MNDRLITSPSDAALACPRAGEGETNGAAGARRFCANCGRQPLRETCCWVLGPEGGHARPCPLLPPLRWEQWNPDEQFLIQVLMREFNGAAEEWELLRRLPWSRWRLEEHVMEFEERPDDAARAFPCFREVDDRDRGRRYYLSDLARHSYETHLREQREAAAFRAGFPFGRHGADAIGPLEREQPNGPAPPSSDKWS
jgi:hypothetical protein